MNNLPKINPAAETLKITTFIKKTLKEQKFKNVAIGLSGGVDSSTCLELLKKTVSTKNIFIAHLYYFKSEINSLNPLLINSGIPKKNIHNLSIKNAVDSLMKTAGLAKVSENYRLRLGNMMARARMILLYDLAKKHQALVCGTENKSEYLLGYFTRFGDEASDFEPIKHLYKTQVYQLAGYLNLPKKIILSAPTAGLWSGQTDETDFGFSYSEADEVLQLYFEENKKISEITTQGFVNAGRIISWAKKNSFKHNLPYKLKGA